MNLSNRQTKFITRKVRNQAIFLHDKYFNLKTAAKVIIPIVLCLAFILIFTTHFIINGYAIKIIRDPELLPVEFSDTVVLFNNNDPLDIRTKLLNSSLDLYQQRKIKRIFVFSILKNDLLNDSEDNYRNIFNDIPAGKVVYNFKTRNISDVCTVSESDIKLSKFILLSYRSYNIRGMFVCNSNDLYVLGFQPLIVDYDNVRTIDLYREVFFDMLSEDFKIKL